MPPFVLDSSGAAPSIESPEVYCAWLDLACDDFLAVEKLSMTSKLAAALEKEGVRVVEVQALSRREAVRKAFPEYHRDGKMVPPWAAPPSSGKSIPRH